MRYFLFLFLLSTLSYSQTGKITYSSVFNFKGKVNEYRSDLYFAKNISFYQKQMDAEKKSNREQKSTEDGDGRLVEINITVGNDSIGDVYYYNLRNPNIVVTRNAIYKDNKPNYFVFNDSTNIKWQLQEEYKEISGYPCQKASTTFRGRNYEAWFTSEIPLSFGPWKFNGLPGLILEIYDQTNQVYFGVEHIQIPYVDAEQHILELSDPIIGHREFIEKTNQLPDHILKMIEARRPKNAISEPTIVKRHSLELEYEWEKE